MASKNCTVCNKLMENVHHAKKYCDKCKKEALKNNQDRHFHKHRDSKKEKNEKTLYENFQNVVKEPFHLTGKGFNTVSDIKCKAYTKFLNKKWVEVLKHYNEIISLVDYIADGYKNFYKETGKVDLHEFAKWNSYCSYDLLMDVGIDEIKNKAGIQKLRYTEEDFINNLKDICEILGKPPLYIEFEQYTKIQLNTYVYKYKLKGKVYGQLMKIMLDKDQYGIYLSRYKNHKSEVGKVTGILSAQYNDEDYKVEFKRVFENCLETYGELPSRRLFNDLSEFEDSMYRRKYNKSWLDICEMYGYKVERNHKAEKMVLNMIRDFIGVDYIPQKTWEWLIGTGGKNMYCDGYYSALNLVVEFDGKQHREPVDAFGGEKSFLRVQENDKLKEKLLQMNNVKLIRIASNTKWHEKEFIQNILLENNIPILTPTI